MTQLRPQWRGLVFKLAAFYVVLSLPTLLLVESTILIFEFQQLMRGVERGSLAQAGARAAAELGAHWPGAGATGRDALGTWLESWILRLERPREGLSPEESYVLLELSADPLAAALLAPDGTPLAHAPDGLDWKPQWPDRKDAAFSRTLAGRSPVTLPGADSPYRIRRVLTPVRDDDGHVLGLLYVELRVPLPWHKALTNLSFEWPILLAYLVVFGLASALFLSAWVTRRLNRVARAAEAWSRGDFSSPIGDPSRDELGRLSARLDRMAEELKSLMRSRAQLATLAERQRLARDLHDTVKQKAFALNLQLATARRVLGAGAAEGRLDQAQRLSNEIQRELAQLLDELRTAEAEVGFGERLRQRAVEWASASDIGLDLDLEPLPPLPVAQEEALLRIADEALANVLRHSGATRVAMALRRDAGRVRLAIGDNGRGAAGGAQAGMGLGNMRERAEALPGGRFELDSLPGRGTRISVSFDLPEVRAT